LSGLYTEGSYLLLCSPNTLVTPVRHGASSTRSRRGSRSFLSLVTKLRLGNAQSALALYYSLFNNHFTVPFVGTLYGRLLLALMLPQHPCHPRGSRRGSPPLCCFINFFINYQTPLIRCSDNAQFFCYLLFAICYLLFAICYLLFVICYLLFAICYLLFVICYLLFAICYLLFVI